MAVGGGTRSNYWLKLVASVLNLPLDLPQDGDFGAAFGAARLGLLGAEGADPSVICTQPDIARSFEPAIAMIDDFEAAYQTYRAAYPAISAIG